MLQRGFVYTVSKPCTFYKLLPSIPAATWGVYPPRGAALRDQIKRGHRVIRQRRDPLQTQEASTSIDKGQKQNIEKYTMLIKSYVSCLRMSHTFYVIVTPMGSES